LQRFTLNQFHDQKLLSVRPFETINRGDVGVVEGCQKPCFPFKPRQAFLIQRKWMGQHLNGYLTLQIRVLSQIDFSHASPAKFT
jgi:hypothetical protein